MCLAHGQRDKEVPDGGGLFSCRKKEAHNRVIRDRKSVV